MREGMIEVEIKIPLSSHDFGHIQEAILKLGGKYLTSESQQDIYYDHPCRSFQKTDEAVRVRKCTVFTHEGLETDHPQFELVYKGPKLDEKSKTRLEISIGISDGAIANEMFEKLGFRKVAIIIKKRAFFKYGLTTICIDDVEDVGLFMELERLVPKESALEPFRKQLFEIVNNLGINTKTSIRKSYLELYLEKRSQ